MNLKTSAIVFAALLACTVLPSAAVAQSSGAEWHGQDTEFGSIRAPYSVDMNGQRVPVEAKIVLRKMYEDQDSRFFMFAWTVENTPMDVTFDHLLRMDTGQELPCYQKQGDGNSQLKCFVDLKDMPPTGTEIQMKGTVGSSRVGSFQVGAIVVPFTYTWNRVQMSGGLDAELYGYEDVNINQATSGGSSRLGGLGNAIPGVGLVATLAVLGGAAGLVAIVRRR
jgi:hypothetical protein